MIASIPTLIQGLAVSCLAAAAYFSIYRINEVLDPWALYAQGINLIFLPAGIKHLSILMGGKWGALGCFLALFVLANEFWSGQPLYLLAFYAFISTAATWVAIVISLRFLGISPDLKNLRFFHLPIIDCITTAAHGFTTNSFFIAAGMKSEHFVQNALAMMFGDFTGSFIILTLLWFALTIWKKLQAPSGKM